MIKDKFAQELAWAAENVKDHTVELICGKGSNEIWRCTKNGSSTYGFDLVISRFGIAMYGDTDSLVFSVGSSYGIEFLARSSVCSYMISKLESVYREKRELCEESLKQVIIEAGCRLLKDKFVSYIPEDGVSCADLPEWLDSSDPKDVTLEKVIEEMKKHAPEQPHTLFDLFEVEVDALMTHHIHDGLEAVQGHISNHYDELNLGCEWYEHTISKYPSSLIQRLEMLRLCALKIQEVKNAGDGNEEHPV